MSKETKYRLAFKAPGAAAADTSSGGHSLGITCGGLPVMGEEDLGRAFERLRAIERECADDNRIACAERVLREIGLE